MWVDQFEVRCRQCRAPLGYDIGSLRDRYDTEKLCPKCAGEKMAAKTIEAFANRLKESAHD